MENEEELDSGLVGILSAVRSRPRLRSCKLKGYSSSALVLLFVYVWTIPTCFLAPKRFGGDTYNENRV